MERYNIDRIVLESFLGLNMKSASGKYYVGDIPRAFTPFNIRK